MKKLASLTSAGLFALASVASAQTTVLINDSFTDNGRTNGADANDAQWYYIEGGSTATLGSQFSSTSAGTGTLITSSRPAANANPHWITNFSSTTLNVGESLSLSFTYASTDTTSQPTGGLRFGFYNSGGTSQTSDLPGSTVDALYQNDVGYTLFAPRANSGNIQLYSKNTNSQADGTNITTTLNTALPGTVAITTSTLGSATPTTFTATLLLTRTSDGYSYSSTWGGATLNGSTTTVLTDTFDTLEIFSFLGGSAQTRLDDVVLTYTSAIPEPSSYAAILGAFALAGVAARRRSRAA